MRKVSIGVVADYYIGWMGGASILAAILNCLFKASKYQSVQIHVFLSARNLVPASYENINIFISALARSIKCDGLPLSCLIEGVDELKEIIFYKDLKTTLNIFEIDVIAPTGNLGESINTPWFGYLPDFQHQYLPHFFSQNERLQRDRDFRLLLENCSAGLFVNSASVASDIAKFYPQIFKEKRIFKFPQLFHDIQNLSPSETQSTLEKYNLSAPYIISCSQRWVHKQHDLILKGFAKFRVSNPNSPLKLVFTGQTSDYRSPQHEQKLLQLTKNLGLETHVQHLGFISRPDQVSLIYRAQGLIQASVFEGGPGASGVLEAALIGTPIIASNIEVNKEMQFGSITFFDCSNPNDLARKIETLISKFQSEGLEKPPLFSKESKEVLSIASGIQLIEALRTAIV